MMSKIFLWSFIAYGMTSIIVWGSIFEKPRNWIIKKSNFFGSLVTCNICCSTWVGFLLSIITGGLFIDYFNMNYIVGIFLDGMFTAGVVWMISVIVEFFEENRFNIK